MGPMIEILSCWSIGGYLAAQTFLSLRRPQRIVRLISRAKLNLA